MILFSSGLLILLVALNQQVINVSAQIPEQEDPGRTTTIAVTYTEYEWWLMTWLDNQVLCQIFVDHEGLPTQEEVLRDCGEEIGNRWPNTPPCELDEEENEKDGLSTQ